MFKSFDIILRVKSLSGATVTRAFAMLSAFREVDDRWFLGST
jgi:hypothetical protein